MNFEIKLDKKINSSGDINYLVQFKHGLIYIPYSIEGTQVDNSKEVLSKVIELIQRNLLEASIQLMNWTEETTYK